MMASQPAVWTILSVLGWSTGYFKDKGISDPRASAEVLLAHALGVSRLDLYLRHDQPLSPEELARFKQLLLRRRQGEPVAYITGHKEFWSLDFVVTPDVLIPRPETEVLVEVVIQTLGKGGQKPRGATCSSTSLPPPPYWGLELGVGSGAVVVSLARELPDFSWLAVDVSGPALEIARLNARRHGTAEKITFLKGDLLSALSPRPFFALLVANLPYVSDSEWEALPREVRDFEPATALLAGPDGLNQLRPVAQAAHHVLVSAGCLALEVSPTQAPTVKNILVDSGAYENPEIIKDYSGRDRVVLARKK